MLTKQYYVYLLTNFTNQVIYTGATNNLLRRIYEHKNAIADSFTKKYKVQKLVYFEVFEDVEYAIKREKQIKAGSRQKKINLINQLNPNWKDLWNQIAQ